MAFRAVKSKSAMRFGLWRWRLLGVIGTDRSFLMGFKRIIGNFIRALMVLLIAVSFAMFVDVFVIDTQPQHAERRFASVRNAQDPEIASLKDQHKKYMTQGIDTALDYSRKSMPLQDSLELPRTEVASDTSSRELKHDAFEIVSASRTSLLAPELAKEKEARIANFGIKADGSEAETAAQIEPASGGDAVRESVPDVSMVLVPSSEEAEDILEKVAEPIIEPEVQSVPHKAEDGKVRVVVIIDDMGVSPANSTKVENLPAPLTLAYLPYAKNLPQRTARAKANGHELMVHMPMQPMSNTKDGGPAVLKVGMDDAKFQEVLIWGLSQFEGYVGLNNHMGSRLTKDRAAMDKVMAELAKRDVYFVDSKTIGSSVASLAAAQAGLRYADRDVFLDHEISDSFVAGALKQLEATARRQGYAIAIGHPHPETIRALEKWIPTLAEKGIELVPASQVVHRDERYIKVSHSAQ